MFLHDWLALISTAIPPEETILRLCVALALGMCIGIDREWRNKPAGLRTHMLVSLSTATFTILATELTDKIVKITAVHPDPLRVLEAITAGAAFLGAGAIIQSRGNVLGMTTGASIWLTAAIGLACGTGALLLAAITTGLAVIVLTLIGLLVHKITEENSPKPPNRINRQSRQQQSG